MALLQFSSTNFVDYQVGLTLGVGLGYKISGGAIQAPRPTLQVTQDFNGGVYPWVSSATNVKLLSITVPATFQTIPDKAGKLETITLTNQGSAPVNVQAPVFSNLMTVANPVYSGGAFTPPPWDLDPGQSAYFGLRYTSKDVGVFNEALAFPTNEADPIKRFDISVLSNTVYALQVTPPGYNINTTLPGENFIGTYTMVAIIDEIEDPTYSVPFTAVITGSNSWSIDSTDINTVRVRYNAWINNNTTATYTATLTISAPGVTAQNFLNTATQAVDFSLNRSSSTWISKLTLPDAIVGIRLDYVQERGTTNTVRTLTIGVGSGADGSQPVGSSVGNWFTIDNLSPAAGRGKYPFAYWQTVYQIPLQSTSTNRTYYSGNYRVKTQEPNQRDYDWYYGHHDSEGSMFIIDYDFIGNVHIKFNDLRELSSSTSVNQTLERLPRVFYYYTDVVDDPIKPYGHIENGPRDEFGNFNSVQGVNTLLLTGFDEQSAPMLSLVPLPN